MWLVQWLVQGLALAVVATAAVRLVPATSPRQRHLFWWLVLAATLALPWTPALIAPRDGVLAASGTASGARALALEVAAPPAWLWTACLATWGAVTLVSLLSLVADLRALRLLKRRTRALSSPDSGVAAALRAHASAVRGTRLAVSDELTGACAAGYSAPRVIVSARLASSLDPSALESVVRHELAHLERYDDWLRLLQRLVLAVAGLHPAVRWISQQIDVEREAACDRLVVERTGDPLGYARALTSVAELMSGSRQAAPRLAPGASITGAGLHARVLRLLGAPEADARRVRPMVAASVASLAVALVGIASVPPLVGIASLEPLLTLGRLPAGRALLPRLPVVQARSVTFASGAPALDVLMPPQPGAPQDLLDQPSPQAPGVARIEQPGVEASSTAADVLEVPVRRELRVETMPAALPPSGAVSSIGARAARVGSATGSTAVRAGSAIGRFFSHGGQAVAGRL